MKNVLFLIILCLINKTFALDNTLKAYCFTESERLFIILGLIIGSFSVFILILIAIFGCTKKGIYHM